MGKLADFRKEHPEYNDMNDAALGDALHRKFYSDMPKADFDQKMGIAPLGSSQKQAPTWGEAFKAAPGAALHQVGSAIETGANAIAHPIDTAVNVAKGVAGLPGALIDEAGGMVQYARNLSPPELRGSAPEMKGGEAEKHPYLALMAADTAPMRQQIATKPLNVAMDAAALTGSTAAGRAAFGRVSDLALAPGRRLGRAVRDLSPERRAQSALRDAAQESGDPQLLARLLEQNRSAVPGMELSASQATFDPHLTALERRSRMTQGPSWTNFDTGQNTALYNALDSVVGHADDAALQGAKDTRAAATHYDREAALALANQGSLEAGAGYEGMGLFNQPAARAVRDEMAGPRGVNPSVTRVGDWMQGTVLPRREAGATYEARKIISDALNKNAGIDTGDLASGIKSAGVSSQGVKSAIDTGLNRATGGMWQQYLDAFREGSATVDDMRALNRIREDLISKEGGLVDMAGSPKLTRAFLQRTIQKHAETKYGPAFSADTERRLNDILHTAQTMEAPQANFRGAVTGGGGSNTPADLALAGGEHLLTRMIPGGRLVAGAARAIGGLGENAGATRLANLLQSQTDAGAALRAALARDAARARRSTGRKQAALAAALAAPDNQ